MGFKGGSMFSEDGDKAVRLVSIVATPVFVVYNLFVMSGVVESYSYFGPIFGGIVSALWIIVGAYAYFSPPSTKGGVATRLILHHALAIATLVGITGFMNPFAPAVTLLFLASHLYFGWFGLSLSLASVVIASVGDMVIRSASAPSIVNDNVIGTISILTLGAALVWIIATQETRRIALINSQERERLNYERTMTIINNLSDAALSTDQSGTILLYNAACLDLIDTNASIKGKKVNSLFQLTSAEDKKPVKLYDLLKEASRAGSRDDLIHTYKDGEEIRLELTYAPIKTPYGRQKKQPQGGYILIIRDVTKRKSLEEERDEFISVVSHELRTPITIAEGTISNLGLIVDRSDKISKKAIGGTIKMAHDQILYLAKMINDLGTLSRAERGVGDEAESIDVKELMHTLYSRYQKEASDKKLKLDLDIGARLGSVETSRLYLEELLQNFITNAIKYTKSGTVTVIAKRKDGVVEFAVKDTGIGIGRAEQSKIFDKFYRSEDFRIRETGGTGLGLYVSAKLAKKIGAQIDLTSRLNHGSTFSFTLPIESDGPSK